MQQNTKLVESYFYKYLADIIWAGSDTYIEIIASDFINQSAKISDRIKIPKKNFDNKTAKEIIKIRENTQATTGLLMLTSVIYIF